MRLILGERDYERSATGKYPKYNLDQLNKFIIMSDPQYYSAICVVTNMLSYDLFGKYEDEITPQQKKILDERIKDKHGFHNVNIDDFIDYDKYEYISKKGVWIEKS